jgi:PadR family transcriptional regulator, regulatory protein PadR
MERLDLPQGTLDLLVLRMLSGAELHGWGIAQKLSILSKSVLRLQEGTLYPALYRMEAKGWIVGDWALSETNRRAKFYRLTRVGRKRLEEEKREWERLKTVVAAVLQDS